MIRDEEREERKIATTQNTIISISEIIFYSDRMCMCVNLRNACVYVTIYNYTKFTQKLKNNVYKVIKTSSRCDINRPFAFRYTNMSLKKLYHSNFVPKNLSFLPRCVCLGSLQLHPPDSRFRWSIWLSKSLINRCLAQATKSPVYMCMLERKFF